MSNAGTSRLALAALLLLPAAASAQTSLTIYQDGHVLERRIFPLAVPAGVSAHRIPVGRIEIGSLFALDSGVIVTGALYDTAVDETTALRRAIGRRISFWTGSSERVRPDTIELEVVGVEPERYRTPDGRILYRRPGVPLFPADLVAAAPSALATVRSDRARPSLGLGYFSSGASWRAEYTVTLGGARARLVGHAVISAGRLQADSAEVQLLAGRVRRPPSLRQDQAIAFREAAAAAPGDAASEEAVGEGRLYTLPGRLSFTPGLLTTALLFDPATAPVDRSYVVRGQLPYYGPLPQFGEEETVQPVLVSYTLERRARTGFGDLPLPAGTARIYQPDATGRPQLVGEANVRETPPGRNVTLEGGTAFDLTARRVQTQYSTRRDSTRTIALATYRVGLSNAKDSVVTIDVLEERRGEWSVLSSSVTAERLSSTVTRFRVRVPARGEATLTYRVRVVW